MKSESVLALLLLFICSGCDYGTNKQKVSVVVTTSLLADAVRQIAGDEVELTQLMPVGTDPHNYTPIASDAIALNRADIIFCHGLHLEGKMIDMLKQRRAIAVSERLPRTSIRLVDRDSTEDPHVWFDVRLWIGCVQTVADELCRVDPAHADDYRQRCESYLKELRALHQEVQQLLQTVPPERRILVTTHDAYGYFGLAYGWQVRGLQGVSTSASIGTKDIDELANFLATNRIPAIFTESSTPSKGLSKVISLAEERAQPTLQIRLVGDQEALFSDSLGPLDTTTGTYIGTVRHNITVIVRYLKP